MTEQMPASSEKASEAANQQPTPPPSRPWVTQSKWRLLGVGCLGGAALMAWHGASAAVTASSIWHLLGYWGIFLVLIAVAAYTVVLDIRYIRLQYAIGRRRLFLQTLGSEQFRKNLLANRQAPSADDHKSGDKCL